MPIIYIIYTTLLVKVHNNNSIYFSTVIYLFMVCSNIRVQATSACHRSVDIPRHRDVLTYRQMSNTASNVRRVHHTERRICPLPGA